MRETSISENLILRSAPSARIGKLKRVSFETGEHFWPAESARHSVLFPVRGVVSLQIVTDGGKPAQAALVGHEGFAEVSFLFGARRTRAGAIALTDGEAVMMEAGEFRVCLDNSRFRAAVHQYSLTFLWMLYHMGVCNRIHVFDKTLVGRLLLMQDRTGSDHFDLTQDFFSRILGVRQATVSRAAANLQKVGGIRYERRGRVTILDRRELEKQACPCYRSLKSDFDGLISALK